ncbi:hypothetical protein AOQ84DRAFT_386178 [Glonium stellatum]|uniref:BTB domain-containing protein n=1 Tax=Glonium stellatum TaxID=574774 RepID=A0A8E2JX35_9PEZI|nr:hypothetical protein AOQ84DRAFT_386178 [Glonium stellatum]
MARAQTRQLLMSSLRSLFKSGDYSDFKIVCGNNTYPVHKAIICTRSDYFARVVRFGKEAGEGKITFPEEEAEMVELILKYFYELDYEPSDGDSSGPSEPVSLKLSDERALRRRKSIHGRLYTSTGLLPCGHEHNRDCEEYCVNYRIESSSCSNGNGATSSGNGEQLVTHAKMYAIADKYQITGLKALASEKFRTACELHWDKQAFASAAHIVYASTLNHDKGLRNIVAQTISGNMSLLKKPEIEALMTEFNGLAFGVLKEKAMQYRWC